MWKTPFGLSYSFVQTVDMHYALLTSGIRCRLDDIVDRRNESTPHLMGAGFGDVAVEYIRHILGYPLNRLATMTIDSLSVVEVNRRIFAKLSSEQIVAGKLDPVFADSAFVPFATDAMETWEFSWITDTAVPRPGRQAASYSGVRVFSASEWAAELGLKRQRSTSPSVAMRVGKSDHASTAAGLKAATEWMSHHVTEDNRLKRADAIKRCGDDCRVPMRIAQEAWNAMSPEIKGGRGRRK